MDIFFVCVRKDIPRTEALAAVFHAAGFSIGDVPSADAAPQSSGVGILVWSRASMQSLPFLAAARSVVQADPAVIVSLTKAPLPPSIGAARAFDLSRWNGDPDDASVDPLFDAVEILVTDLRAQVEHRQTTNDSRNVRLAADNVDLHVVGGASSEAAELRSQQFAAGEPRAQPGAAQAAVKISSSSTVSHASPAPEESINATADLLAASPINSARRPSNDVRTCDRSNLRDPARPGRSARRHIMLIPFLTGASLAGIIYFGGVGESNKAPRYMAHVRAPVDVGSVVHLDEPMSAPSAEELSLQSPVHVGDIVNEPVSLQSADESSEQAPRASSRRAARRNPASASIALAGSAVPPIASMNASERPALLRTISRSVNAPPDASAPLARRPVPTATIPFDLERAFGAESSVAPQNADASE